MDPRPSKFFRQATCFAIPERSWIPNELEWSQHEQMFRVYIQCDVHTADISCQNDLSHHVLSSASEKVICICRLHHCQQIVLGNHDPVEVLGTFWNISLVYKFCNLLYLLIVLQRNMSYSKTNQCATAFSVTDSC